MDSKPRRQASNQNVMVDGIKWSRKVKKTDRIVSVSWWHLRDDHGCTAEQFQWSGVCNRLTGEHWEDCWKTDDQLNEHWRDNAFNNLRYRRQVRDWLIVWQLVFDQGRFLEEGRYCRFFKKWMESTRAEREINNVGILWGWVQNIFFEKPSGYRVRIRLFVRAVEQDLINFRFRCRPEGRENRRCWWRRRSVWRRSRRNAG